MVNTTGVDRTSSDSKLAGKIPDFAQGKSVLIASRYTIAAAVTIFIYDIFLTLADEIELVWRHTMWTFPALLYIVNRYLTLASLLFMCYLLSPFHPALSKSFCQQGVTSVGFCIGVAAWGGIMSLRAAALWKTQRLLVWSVWMSWGCLVVVMTAGTFSTSHTAIPTLNYDGSLHVCTSQDTSRIQILPSAVQGIFVLFITFLTVLKFYQFPSALHSLKDMSSLMRLLLQDGLIYFMVVSILSVASGISWLLLPAATGYNRMHLFMYLNWSIFSTIVARLFLRLRKIFYGPSTNPPSSNRTYSYYSTNVQSNVLPIDQVIEHDTSRFFSDEEFAVMSAFDVASFYFLPVDLRSLSPDPLSGSDTIAESVIIPVTRPTTSMSVLSYPPPTARPTTARSNRTRPQTALSIWPNTRYSLFTVSSGRTVD